MSADVRIYGCCAKGQGDCILIVKTHYEDSVKMIEKRIEKTNALLASNNGKMVLIDELTTFYRTQLPDLSWSESEPELPNWQYGISPLTACEVSDVLISSSGEIFKLITEY